MSGGSFNYLCFVEDHFGADEIFKRDEDLKRMAYALSRLQGDKTAVRHTEQLISKIDAVRNEISQLAKQLSPVWKAVEWYYSSDWGEDRVVEAVNQYAMQHGSIIKLVDSDE